MKIFIILIFSFLNLYSEKIELKDGTVIYGDFEGVVDDYYVIRTKYGVLSVSSSDINIPSEIIINSSSTQIQSDSGVEMKIITKKTEDGYVRNFYVNSIMVATQTFNSSQNLLNVYGTIKDGIYYEYDEKGNMLAERTIKNGLENGPVIEFYPDGIIKSRIDFKDGKISGKAFFYTNDSRLILEQSFTNGVLDGFSVEYDLDGNIKSKVLYSNGKLATTDKTEEETKELKEEKNDKKVSVTDTYSVKTINIARGKKVFVYKNNRYIGSFTFDNDYNIIDVTGKIPDKDIEIKEPKITLSFSFLNNWPVNLKITKSGNLENEYIYDENGKAIKK